MQLDLNRRKFYKISNNILGINIFIFKLGIVCKNNLYLFLLIGFFMFDEQRISDNLLKLLFVISLSFLLMSEDCSEPNSPLKRAVLAPNPATDHITLIFEVSEEVELKIGIYDTNGTLILEHANNQIFLAGENKIEFNLSNFTSGVYLCRIESAQLMETLKFSVSK